MERALERGCFGDAIIFAALVGHCGLQLQLRGLDWEFHREHQGDLYPKHTMDLNEVLRRGKRTSEGAIKKKRKTREDLEAIGRRYEELKAQGLKGEDLTKPVCKEFYLSEDQLYDRLHDYRHRWQ